LFHGGGTESADQLVLQVNHAHVEPQPFHTRASQVGAEAGALETPLEVALLCGVVKTRQPDVTPLRAEQIEEASDSLCTSHRHHRKALRLKIPTAAFSERLERVLIADPFHEHDRTRVSLLLVHITIFAAHSSPPWPIRALSGAPHLQPEVVGADCSRCMVSFAVAVISGVLKVGANGALPHRRRP
jgi:hypothetical protein